MLCIDKPQTRFRRTTGIASAPRNFKKPLPDICRQPEYIKMSDSPSENKETEVEQGPQSPDPEAPMEGNIGFEFEVRLYSDSRGLNVTLTHLQVKEQDRWLPIANG